MTRLMESVLSMDPEPGGPAKTMTFWSDNQTAIGTEAEIEEGRQNSVSIGPPPVLVPDSAIEIWACGGHIFEGAELQSFEGNFLRRHTSSLSPSSRTTELIIMKKIKDMVPARPRQVIIA